MTEEEVLRFLQDTPPVSHLWTEEDEDEFQRTQGFLLITEEPSTVN